MWVCWVTQSAADANALQGLGWGDQHVQKIVIISSAVLFLRHGLFHWPAVNRNTLLTCCFGRQRQPEAKCTEPKLYKYYWHTCIHAICLVCLSGLRVYCPSSSFLLLLSSLLLFTVSAERDWACIPYTGWLWHENYFVEMWLPMRWGKKKAVTQAIISPCGMHLSFVQLHIYTGWLPTPPSEV